MFIRVIQTQRMTELVNKDSPNIADGPTFRAETQWTLDRSRTVGFC